MNFLIGLYLFFGLKTKEGMKYKFRCPITSVRVEVYIGDKSNFKDLSKDSDDSAETYICEKDDKKWFAIWLKDKKEFYDLVHECLHLTHRIFEYVGIPFNDKNTEIIAYYQSYWVETIWHKISKQVS